MRVSIDINKGDGCEAKKTLNSVAFRGFRVNVFLWYFWENYLDVASRADLAQPVKEERASLVEGVKTASCPW